MFMEVRLIPWTKGVKHGRHLYFDLVWLQMSKRSSVTVPCLLFWSILWKLELALSSCDSACPRCSS